MDSIDIIFTGNTMVIKAHPAVLNGIYDILVKSIIIFVNL